MLRSLDDALGPEGVPHIAVTVGSALTIACLFALLFYVHKVPWGWPQMRGAVAAPLVSARAASYRAGWIGQGQEAPGNTLTPDELST